MCLEDDSFSILSNHRHSKIRQFPWILVVCWTERSLKRMGKLSLDMVYQGFE